MPTYEYTCTSCGKKHEAFQKISDKPLTDCPHCHTPNLKRGPGGGFGVSFQGSGFYQTDYPKKSCCPCKGGGHSCEK